MRYPRSVPVLLAIATLAGYAVAARPVQAQTEALPFSVGDTVTFSFNGGGSRRCRIEELRGRFARCGDPSASRVVRYGDPQMDREWINVAVVEWATTPPDRR